MAHVKIDEVKSRLEKSLNEIFENNRFQDLLNVMATGHRYSPNNIIMILSQKPDATMIRSLSDWNKLGRYVKKGEKGIDIFVPTFKKVEKIVRDDSGEPVKDESGEIKTEITQVLTGFSIGKVFDISQTTGKDIPSVREFIQDELQSEENMSELYERFKEYINERKAIQVVEEEHSGQNYGGYYDRNTNKILINTAVTKSPEQKFSVLIHEYAHSQLHHAESKMKDLSRGHKEAQAEATAYIVSHYFGLDTGLSSIGYIATWSKDLKLAKQAIEEIYDTSQKIIDEINELQKDRLQRFYNATNQFSLEDLKAKGINIDEKPVVQLFDGKNGNVIYGTIEKLEHDNIYYIETNSHRYIGLNELNDTYHLVNDFSDKFYRRIEDMVEIKEKEGKYYIQIGNRMAERSFEREGDAARFILRSALSQSLNTDLYLSKADADGLDRLRVINYNHLKERLDNYIKVYSLEHDDNVTLGWHLLKNPEIQNLEQLKQSIDKMKPNLKTTKQLKVAFENAVKKPALAMEK